MPDANDDLPRTLSEGVNNGIWGVDQVRYHANPHHKQVVISSHLLLAPPNLRQPSNSSILRYLLIAICHTLLATRCWLFAVHVLPPVFCHPFATLLLLKRYSLSIKCYLLLAVHYAHPAMGLFAASLLFCYSPNVICNL